VYEIYFLATKPLLDFKPHKLATETGGQVVSFYFNHVDKEYIIKILG